MSSDDLLRDIGYETHENLNPQIELILKDGKDTQASLIEISDAQWKQYNVRDELVQAIRKRLSENYLKQRECNEPCCKKKRNLQLLQTQSSEVIQLTETNRSPPNMIKSPTSHL